MWEETLRLGPGQHTPFVLHKGDNTTSRRASCRRTSSSDGSELGLFQTGFSDGSLWGSQSRIRLRIRNTGSVTWKARGRRFGGQVTLGLKVCDARDEVLREDLGRTPLAWRVDVAPGDEIGRSR